MLTIGIYGFSDNKGDLLSHDAAILKKEFDI